MNGQMQKLFRMFLVSILMLFTFTVNAQEQTITGKVYDVAGEPIIGANVLIQSWYLQPIITQYFIDNKSEIWLLFLIAHSKR